MTVTCDTCENMGRCPFYEKNATECVYEYLAKMAHVKEV